MILYRCGSSEYLGIDGAGALLFNGRFHNIGRKIVYTTENIASGMLEILVNLHPTPITELAKRDYSYLKLKVNENLSIYEPKLKENWYIDLSYTREIGNRWYDEKISAIMKVPSVIVPDTFNYLCNVSLYDINFLKLVSKSKLIWDKRLISS